MLPKPLPKHGVLGGAGSLLPEGKFLLTRCGRKAKKKSRLTCKMSAFKLRERDRWEQREENAERLEEGGL